MNKEMQWRNEGMAYALKIAREKGIEGLEDECKFRNVTYIPQNISRAVCDEAINKIKLNTIDTMLIMAVTVLMDEFEFSKFQIDLFIKRFTSKTDCVVGNYCTWEDLIDDIKQEYGIELSIRRNE